MDKAKFQEFYKKNKVAVIGVPFIIAIVLINNFVLKPSRRAAREEQMPQQAQPARPAQTATETETDERPALVMPAPIRDVTYPDISSKMEKRFYALTLYPYEVSRNIFMPFVEPEQPVMVIETPETVERRLPQITYHGFFKLNKKPVAILRTPYDLITTHAGSYLRQTSYRLDDIRPDRVIITDTSIDIKNSFEIMLSSASGD